MKNERLIQAWNQFNPNEDGKKAILSRIQNDNNARCKKYMFHSYKKCAIACLTAVCILSMSFGTAYAVNSTFRKVVNEIFFPRYTESEFIAVDNGHLTGSFDERNVLLTFLDKFNRKEFENTITAKEKDGYVYALYTKTNADIQAFVASDTDGLQILVYMQRKGYKDTEGLWQISGYQIVSNYDATILKEELLPYVSERVEKASEEAGIKAEDGKILIYNVNEKENIAYLDEKDCEAVRTILDSCEYSDEITGDIFSYIIKIDTTSYLFDSKGNGIVDSGERISGVTLESDKIAEIVKFLNDYQISIEEN